MAGKGDGDDDNIAKKRRIFGAAAFCFIANLSKKRK
jgi:hypothetical protein